jgi:hypothetical protein
MRLQVSKKQLNIISPSPFPEKIRAVQPSEVAVRSKWVLENGEQEMLEAGMPDWRKWCSKGCYLVSLLEKKNEGKTCFLVSHELL